MRACSEALLSVASLDASLISTLADVYAKSPVFVKRTLLRLVDAPVKQIGAHSSELLSMIENCSEGAETLATRIVHLLTERSKTRLKIHKSAYFPFRSSHRSPSQACLRALQQSPDGRTLSGADSLRFGAGGHCLCITQDHSTQRQRQKGHVQSAVVHT